MICNIFDTKNTNCQHSFLPKLQYKNSKYHYSTKMELTMITLNIQSWWEIPSIAHFASLFSTVFKLPDFDIEDLEEALLIDGTETNELDSSNRLLPELIVKLLKGCDHLKLGWPYITTSNYQMFLRRLFRHKCKEYNIENPFNTDTDFQRLPINIKLSILRYLCDFRLDSKSVISSLQNLESDSLRIDPLGFDDNGSAYWYFYGTRLYREDRNLSAAEKKKRKKTDQNSTDSIWQVICFTENDWNNLAAKFENSKNSKERALYAILKENFLPKIPKLFKEKEQQRRKKLFQTRTSSRLKYITQTQQIQKAKPEETEDSLFTDIIEQQEKNVEEKSLRSIVNLYSKERLVRKEKQDLLNDKGSHVDKSNLCGKKREFEIDKGDYWKNLRTDDRFYRTTRRRFEQSRESDTEKEEGVWKYNRLEERANRTTRRSRSSSLASIITTYASSPPSTPNSLDLIYQQNNISYPSSSIINNQQKTINLIPYLDINKKSTKLKDLFQVEDKENINTITLSSDEHEELEEVTIPIVEEKVKMKTEKANSKKSNINTNSKKMPPATNTKLPGRQTNNSLSSLTGNIVIQTPEKEDIIPTPPPMPPVDKQSVDNNNTPVRKKKTKSSEVFTEDDEVLQIGMHKVLEAVKNHNDAWPFMDPVEEDIAPRYYSIIRRPMDLLKMEEKLDNGEYTLFTQFRNDFKLIVNNCRLYNGQENEYTEMVNNLQIAFEKATKKYFEQNSSDEEINLEYPELKTNVFREKYSLNKILSSSSTSSTFIPNIPPTKDTIKDNKNKQKELTDFSPPHHHRIKHDTILDDSDIQEDVDDRDDDNDESKLKTKSKFKTKDKNYNKNSTKKFKEAKVKTNMKSDKKIEKQLIEIKTKEKYDVKNSKGIKRKRKEKEKEKKKKKRKSEEAKLENMDSDDESEIVSDSDINEEKVNVYTKQKVNKKNLNKSLIGIVERNVVEKEKNLSSNILIPKKEIFKSKSKHKEIMPIPSNSLLSSSASVLNSSAVVELMPKTSCSSKVLKNNEFKKSSKFSSEKENNKKKTKKSTICDEILFHVSSDEENVGDEDDPKRDFSSDESVIDYPIKPKSKPERKKDKENIKIKSKHKHVDNLKYIETTTKKSKNNVDNYPSHSELISTIKNKNTNSYKSASKAVLNNEFAITTNNNLGNMYKSSKINNNFSENERIIVDQEDDDDLATISSRSFSRGPSPLRSVLSSDDDRHEFDTHFDYDFDQTSNNSRNQRLPSKPPTPDIKDKFDLIKERRSRNNDDKWNQTVKEAEKLNKNSSNTKLNNAIKDKNYKLNETIEKLKLRNAKAKQAKLVIDEAKRAKQNEPKTYNKTKEKKVKGKTLKEGTKSKTTVGDEYEFVDDEPKEKRKIVSPVEMIKVEKSTTAKKEKKNKKLEKALEKGESIEKIPKKNVKKSCIPPVQVNSKKNNTNVAVLDFETEQTLKDINKWLEHTPRFSEFSSASNSPSRYTLEDLDPVPIIPKIEPGEFKQTVPFEPALTTNQSKTKHPPALSTITSTNSENLGTKENGDKSKDQIFSTMPLVPQNKSLNSTTHQPVASTVTTGLSGITNTPPANQLQSKKEVKESKRKSKEKLNNPIPRKRELQRTIDRLQPGKTKGNLISSIMSTNKSDELYPLGNLTKLKEIKNSLVVKTDENGPKLSLGTVLNTENFGLVQQHNFSDESEIDKLKISDAIKTDDIDEDKNVTNKNEEEETISSSVQEQIKLLETVENKVLSISKDVERNEEKKDTEFKIQTPKVETIPTPSKTTEKPSPTPNLSAWFKAFGAPKNSVQKKKEENEDTTLSSSLVIAPLSPPTIIPEPPIIDMNIDIKKPVTITSIASPLPTVNDHLTYPLPTSRQRKASTGSTISEQSSFSQDPDSPRIGIDERLAQYPSTFASPLGASPIMASPKPDDTVTKANSLYPLNASIKVGFYQDTTSKSSPDKSCSPRELPTPPYPNYSSHVYSSASPTGFNYSSSYNTNTDGSTINSALNYNKTNSTAANYYEQYKQPHSQESDYNSSLSPIHNQNSPYQNQQSPFSSQPTSPYQHSQGTSPYQQQPPNNQSINKTQQGTHSPYHNTTSPIHSQPTSPFQPIQIPSQQIETTQQTPTQQQSIINPMSPHSPFSHSNHSSPYSQHDPNSPYSNQGDLSPFQNNAPTIASPTSTAQNINTNKSINMSINNISQHAAVNDWANANLSTNKLSVNYSSNSHSILSPPNSNHLHLNEVESNENTPPQAHSTNNQQQNTNMNMMPAHLSSLNNLNKQTNSLLSNQNPYTSMDNYNPPSYTNMNLLDSNKRNVKNNLDITNQQMLPHHLLLSQQNMYINNSNSNQSQSTTALDGSLLRNQLKNTNDNSSGGTASNASGTTDVSCLNDMINMGYNPQNSSAKSISSGNMLNQKISNKESHDKIMLDLDNDSLKKSSVTSLDKQTEQTLFEHLVGSMGYGKTSMPGFGKPVPDISTTKAFDMFNKAANYPKTIPTSSTNSGSYQKNLVTINDKSNDALNLYQEQNQRMTQEMLNLGYQNTMNQKQLQSQQTTNTNSYNIPVTNNSLNQQQLQNKLNNNIRNSPQIGGLSDLVIPNPKPNIQDVGNGNQQNKMASDLNVPSFMGRSTNSSVPVNVSSNQQISGMDLGTFKNTSFNTPAAPPMVDPALRNLASLSMMDRYSTDERFLGLQGASSGYYDNKLASSHMFGKSMQQTSSTAGMQSMFGAPMTTFASYNRDQQNPFVTNATSIQQQQNSKVINVNQSASVGNTGINLDTKPEKKTRKLGKKAQAAAAAAAAVAAASQNSTMPNQNLNQQQTQQTLSQQSQQGFQSYAGLKSNSTTPSVEATPISLKTSSVVPGSAFNFGPTPTGLGLYGENNGYLDEYRNAAASNPYYITTPHRSTPETNEDKNNVANNVAAAAASPYHQFLSHPTRSSYPFVNTQLESSNSTIYQQYVNSVINQSLLGAGAPPGTYPQTAYHPLMHKHYDAMNRPWFP